MNVGDYVKVTKVADPWEGGDSEEDRETYIGHVGVVVELSPPYDPVDGSVVNEAMFLVRFPHCIKEHYTGQRWFEEGSVELVSAPKVPISENLFTECF